MATVEQPIISAEGYALSLLYDDVAHRDTGIRMVNTVPVTVYVIYNGNTRSRAFAAGNVTWTFPTAGRIARWLQTYKGSQYWTWPDGVSVEIRPI